MILNLEIKGKIKYLSGLIINILELVVLCPSFVRLHSS